jgi:hypothetical protein
VLLDTPKRQTDEVKYEPPDYLVSGPRRNDAVAVGQVFGMVFKDSRRFVVGRVLANDARIGTLRGLIVARFSSAIRRVPFDATDRPASLGPAVFDQPPMLLARSGWRRGYFVPWFIEPLGPEWSGIRHSFMLINRSEVHVDLYGEPVTSPSTPLGVYQLWDFQNAAIEVASRLGITDDGDHPVHTRQLMTWLTSLDRRNND